MVTTKEIKVRRYFAYDKNGFGGHMITAKNIEEAHRKARELYGPGATAEFHDVFNAIKVML